MIVVAPKRLLVKLVIFHVALFGLITGLANFSIIDEEIDLKNRIYTVEIDFIMPINKETFNESLKLTSEFPKQKPKHTVVWLDSSTVKIKVWDINYPKGQEFKVKINKASTLIPLIKKTETLEFRIPTEPVVIGFNSKKYLSTLEPIRINFNVPMSPENIKKGIKLTDLQTGKLIEGELQPVTEAINGSYYKDFSSWDFQPEGKLINNNRYEILVNSGIRSSAGIKLLNSYKKEITTASKPKIITTSPGNKEAEVSLYPEIQITASEIMKKASVEVKRKDIKSNDLINGKVSVVDNKISFTPEAALLPDTTYEITVVGYSLYDEPTEKFAFTFTT